jgi:DNA processing protein
MSAREYTAALCSYLPFGPVRAKLLISYFGSAEAAWKTDLKSLRNINLSEKVVGGFGIYRKSFDFDSYFSKLSKLSVKYTVIDEPDYPQNLKEIDNPPYVLYYLGTLSKNDRNAVAIVGSRKMSSYGKEVTQRLASELASLGITIVSGLALGVDACAHEACLAVHGRGVVVLASGLDTISPLTNRWIGLKIVQSGGAIFSEYPLGYQPFRSSFPVRNRIVSGLARAVIVVEGLAKSGTLLTASSAAEQGRTVFAVPGQITSPLSAAPHFLIQNGAKLVTSCRDILDELDLQFKVDRDKVESVLPRNEKEEAIYQILENEPLHLDELARISSTNVSEVSAQLTIMEMKGMVRNMGGGVYKRV